MTGSERQTQAQPKDDFGRQLRSASPAIKRPASDMGAQDREEHTTDVEMGDGDPAAGFTPINAEPNSISNSDSKAKQQDTGQRHRERESGNKSTHSRNSSTVQQKAPSDSSGSSISDSLAPTPSIHSTAATSVMMDISPSSTNIPAIDEQVVKVTQLASKDLQGKEKRYLVSTKWLQRVQARSSHPPDRLKIDKSATEGEIGPVDNSDLAMVTEDSGKLLDQAGEKYVALRPNLAMGEDYEALPQEAWDLILSWYGLAKDSPVITRYAYDISESDALLPNIQLELNPPIFSFLKLPCEHTPQTQKEKDLPPQRMLASKYSPFMEWLKKGKELLRIDMNTKVRVWRILGGLKNSSGSGILTPAASRSASPAPGTEVVASAGDRMLLDVNTFAALNLGEHREKLDYKDQTADPNYNGKSTLAIVGLGRDEVIVLEEQKGGLGGGDWPSENVRLTLGKNIRDKAKGLTPSGRSSPAPGMTTRGRSRRDGRPRGITGLSNLGNTCYMNSALQCIRSVEELTQFFLHDQWKKELNPDNPLGHHGEVAKAYANLVKQIYEENASSTNPSRFKAVIGKYGPSFSGYQQQDSQEFLLFLLDGLQEDLNRIRKKPYIEKPDSTDEMVHDHKALKAFADKNWDDYKARNDSVITDLFAGMYKSTVTCPVCQKVSIIFDPFNNLTLQLPIENNWAKEILYFPLHKRPFRVDVDIDKHSSIRALKEFVGKRTHAEPDLLLVAESYKSKIYKIFDNVTVISDANIQPADVICVYEMDSTPTNYNPNKAKKFSSIFTLGKDAEDELVEASSPAADRLLVPMYNRVVKSPSSKAATKPFFGLPSYVVLDRESNKTMDGLLKKVLGNVVGMTTRSIFDEDSPIGTDPVTPEDSDTVDMTDDTSSLGSNLPNAASVEGEDGIVDVSMRDASLAPQSGAGRSHSVLENALRLGVPLHAQLKTLFSINVVSTGEGIPTGWSQINEHNEYDPVQARVVRPVSRQSGRGGGSLNVVNGDTESVSSDNDLEDIDHEEANNSSSESAVSAAHVTSALYQSDLREIEDMNTSRSGRKKTYKGKRRSFLGKGKQQRRTPTVQSQPQSQPASEGLVHPGEAIVLDWTAEAYEALFGGLEDDEEELRGAPTWKSVELLPDEALAARRAQRSNRKKNGITLEDCLNEFGKSETLSEANAWYCPRCKEHRRANKMFELWKAPDILVMHLKRFSSNRSFRDKLEVRVEYPIEGLDLSTMVQDKDEEKSLLYDLIAVDNHYGGLGGGHYTAYAKNFVNHGWYEYNDSHVSARPEPSAVVTTAAYLLFYRRRSDHPLGGPSLQEFLMDANPAEADSETQRGSREPSPMAGEGRRLGDSSHNGSSSASGAVQAHLVGVGGTAIKLKQNQDLLLEDEVQEGSHGMENNDLLPGYTAAEDRKMGLDDDEAIGGMDYDMANQPAPSWTAHPAWGFDKLLSQNVQPPPSENDDVFGDHAERGSSNDSTRVEGDAASTELLSDEDLQDAALYSEGVQQDDHGSRSMRESAPAPDFVPSVGDGMDDDDDLPVAELKAGDDGNIVVSHSAR